MPLRQTLTQAHKLKTPGLEIEAAGELSPFQLTESGRRELKHLLRSHDLEPAALLAPMRRGLDVAEDLERRVDYLKQTLRLSFDLGPRLVVASIGKVVEDEKDPRHALMRASLEDLVRHGDRVGARLAIETGLESAEVLKAFLSKFDTGSLAVCFNPGALLAGGLNPYENLRALHGMVVHAHARDARLVSVMGRAQEVPVGQGDIDWMQLAAAFEEIDYRGWLVVDGDKLGTGEIAASVGFLRRIFG